MALHTKCKWNENIIPKDKHVPELLADDIPSC